MTALGTKSDLSPIEPNTKIRANRQVALGPNVESPCSGYLRARPQWQSGGIIKERKRKDRQRVTDVGPAFGGRAESHRVPMVPARSEKYYVPETEFFTELQRHSMASGLAAVVASETGP